MQFDYRFDPFEVLETTAGESLLEIRDAFRAKVKKHHPDHGGDEWAFRVVNRAYEVLSTARVMGRAAEEFARTGRDVPPPPPDDPEPFVAHDHPDTATASTAHYQQSSRDEDVIRPGVRVNTGDRAKVVDVEMFLVRFQVDDPMQLVNLPPKDRNLSCCLHVEWPSRELDETLKALIDKPEVVRIVAQAFKAVARSTGGIATKSTDDRSQFVGWLYYPTALSASEAFQALRKRLIADGLGVVQWTRELVIPKDGIA